MTVRALLVYPEMPPTYWSMRYALPFIGRQASLPPLGLLTVAALLPRSWDLRLVDLNVESLSSEAIAAADLVLASAMLIQRDALETLVARCRAAGTPVIAGGPFPTSCREALPQLDAVVRGEAEACLPGLLDDFARGRLQGCYGGSEHPDLSDSPTPRYDLIAPGAYAGAALQFSRGCPHHCEFCDVVELFGHRPRTKSPEQFVAEVDLLYRLGWRGSLFVVDDNFIGNRTQVRRLLPRLAKWQARHGYPFTFFTEAGLNLASDGPLMDDMVEAGFNMVFVGIESPDPTTLEAAGKQQNLQRDLLDSVRTIQSRGLEVSAGFILGFDTDPEDVFERQVRFIEAAAIPTAMVGLLTALPGTRLHARLASEGRLSPSLSHGNNTHDLEMNFRPRMEAGRLLRGYTRVLRTIYTPRRYFARCLELLRRMPHRRASCRRVGLTELRAFVRSLLRQTFSRYGLAYWMFLIRGFGTRPRMGAEIVTMAVKGHHFFTITRGILALARLRTRLDKLQEELDQWLREAVTAGRKDRINPDALRLRLIRIAQRQYQRIHPDFRPRAAQLLQAFQDGVRRVLVPDAPGGGLRIPSTR